jgi:hypothetical protein
MSILDSCGCDDRSITLRFENEKKGDDDLKSFDDIMDGFYGCRLDSLPNHHRKG